MKMKMKMKMKINKKEKYEKVVHRIKPERRELSRDFIYLR